MITEKISKTQRNYPVSMTLTDFIRIQNQIVPSNTEYENRKALDLKLKTVSATKTKKWPDSLELKRKKELEYTKRKFFEEEKRRRLIDEEEHKYNEIQKNLFINRAKQKLFEQQDAVKSFNGKLMFCDVLKERDYQKDIHQRLKTMENIINKSFYDMEIKQIEDYDKKVLEKKLLNEQKIKERMKFLNDQFQESKIKKLQEQQEKLIEGQLMKIQMKKSIQEDKRIQQKKEKIKQQRINDYIEANKILEQRKEEQKKKEIEENRKIDEFNIKKQQQNDLRKKVIGEKMKERNLGIQNLIDRQNEYLKLMKTQGGNKEEEINKRILKEREEKREKEEKEKKERLDQIKNDIKLQREEIIKKKEDEKIKIKKENEKYMDDWKKKMKIIEMEEKNEFLLKKEREKNLAKYQKLQLEEKKRIARKQFLDLVEDSYKNKLGMEMEANEFYQYTEFWIKEYKKQGKNIDPLLLELKKYKSNCSF